MIRVRDIYSRQILDSRGIPTVEATVELDNGCRVTASVPSGTSTGRFEAFELRDSDGGVGKAVSGVMDKIAPKMHGLDITDQAVFDQKIIELDPTENKSKLGANAILAVSEAILRAKSVCKKQELYETIQATYSLRPAVFPKPMAVMIEGGVHSDSNLDIQELMIVSTSEKTETNIAQILMVYRNLKDILQETARNTNVGMEGAYGPNFSSNREALDFILAAIEKSKLEPGRDINICLDFAANSFWDEKNQKYFLKMENAALTSAQMIAYITGLVNDYPIISIEDGLSEDDIEGWQELTAKLGSKILIIGDDLFVTNHKKIEEGIKQKLANAVLIKPNQIGTITETVNAIKLAKATGWTHVVSHRSGETNDDFIVDLAVASGSEYLKIGAPSRGERIAKYNRLMALVKEKQ